VDARDEPAGSVGKFRRAPATIRDARRGIPGVACRLDRPRGRPLPSWHGTSDLAQPIRRG